MNQQRVSGPISPIAGAQGRIAAWARWGAGLLLAWAGLVQADTGHARAPVARSAVQAEDPSNARVIVKYRADASLMKQAQSVRPQHATTLAKRLSLPLVDGRVLGDRVQALRSTGLSSRQLADRLAAQADVEWAVVDQRRTINAVLPNDPYYGPNQTSITPTVGQWYLRAPDSTIVSATNAIGAWAMSTGSSAITVAVLDTGVRKDHPDLAGKLWDGYDFISRTSNSADGDGRDADASDPGDWSTGSDSCGAGESSWHGTQVAGLIGAATDNAIGMAGLGRNVMVLPVRVLGKCGGFDSDIIAGMRWAAGLSSDPVVNSHPARVINMSLGGSGSCSSAYSDVVAELTAAKVAVVVAAGNDSGHAVNSPANCAGAIGVAGLRHAGTKVGYSNVGPELAIAAPAGNCVNTASNSACLYPLLTTMNSGTTSPGANTYSDSFTPTLGTSFSAPLVAGTVALMLSLDSSLTPARIKTLLQSTARPFVTTGGSDATVRACTAPTGADQLECYCTTSTCGAGMLDTSAAVNQIYQTTLVPSAAIKLSSASPTAGQNVTLDGTGSTAAGGRSILAYQWSVSGGANLASLSGATNGSTATLLTSGAGTVTVTLTVTDSAGVQSTTSSTVSVQAVAGTGTNSGSGGGGGAMGWAWLAGLAAATGLLGHRRRRAAGGG